MPGLEVSCGLCGWPSAAATCPMCGRSPRAPGYDTTRGPSPEPDGPRPEDFPELREAFLAWKGGAWEEMVERCLAVLGMQVPSPGAPAGTVGWTTHIDSAALYVYYDRQTAEVVAEAPVVWVPEHQRVALMRTLLELNARSLGAARFCLHADVVVVRYADRIENVSPPKLIAAIREVGVEADRHDNWLAETFGARMIGPEAQRNQLDWRYLGVAMPLPGFDATPSEGVGGPAAPPQPEHQLLELLAAAVAMVARVDPDFRGPARVVVRAAVCRAWGEHRADCPAAVSLVLDGGRAVFGFPLGHEATASQVAAWLSKLVAMRELLPTLAAVPAPPVPPLEVPLAAHVDALLRAVPHLGGEDVAHYVLLGGAAELVMRTAIEPERAARLQDAVRQAVSAAPGPAIELLQRALQEVAR